MGKMQGHKLDQTSSPACSPSPSACGRDHLSAPAQPMPRGRTKPPRFTVIKYFNQ